MGNTARAKMSIGFSKRVGLLCPFEHSGKYTLKEQAGYDVAIDTVLYSLLPGKITDAHTQFSLIRGVRMVVGKHARYLLSVNSLAISLVSK